MPDTFDGAVGHGKACRGAYNGGSPTVHRVTNLNDTGAGSFRAAWTASGNRQILFDVSGRIDATSDRMISGGGNVHVVGQSAPAPGITIYGSELRAYNSNHVFVEHVRIIGAPGETRKFDSVFLYNCDDVYFRHCTILWPNDEPISIADSNRVTFERCLIEGKRAPDGGKPEHWGLVFGWQQANPANNHFSTNVTVLGCLFVNCNARNPKVTSGCSAEIINCFWVNPGDGSDGLSQCGTKFAGDTASLYVDYIKGATIIGPESDAAQYYISKYDKGITAGSKIHVDSWLHTDSISSPTVGRRQSVGAGNDWDIVNNSQIPSGTYQALTPQASSGITAQSVADAYASIITDGNVGSRQADRVNLSLEPDTGILNEARTPSTAVHKTSTNVTAPSYSQNTLAFTMPANPNDDSGSGYTNAEVAFATARALVEPQSAPGGDTGEPTGGAGDFPVVEDAATSDTDSNGTSHTVAFPTTVSAGSLLLLASASDGSGTLTIPSGFTAIAASDEEYGSVRHRLSYKLAAGTEGGTTTSITSSANEQCTNRMWSITGWDSAVVPTSTVYEIHATATPNSPSITASVSGRRNLVFSVYAADNGQATDTYPAGYTGTGSNATGGSGPVSQAWAYKEVDGDTEDPGAFGMAAAEEYIAYSIIVSGEEMPADPPPDPPAADVSMPRRFWQQCVFRRR